jgi:hypothetical protein
MISVLHQVRAGQPIQRTSQALFSVVRSLSLVAALGLAVLLMASPAEPGMDGVCQQTHKVLPPIEVFLEPQDDLTPGEVVRFRVVVIPKTVPREVRVTWRPAPAIEWISGDTLSVRAGAVDRRDELNAAVRVPTRGFHPLHVTVELVTEDGTVWRRGVGTRLGPDDVSRTARRVSTGSDGRTYVEYPAAPATPRGER